MVRAGDFNESAVCKWHSDSLSLASVSISSWNEAASDTGCGYPRLAVGACAIAICKWGDDEITFSDVAHLIANLLHYANKLVPNWTTRCKVRFPAVVPKIGTTDTCQYNTYNCVGWLLYFWIWTLTNF